ncbi:MAG: asparagine synthase (glutamine-hydrolyzing) [Saprospiraceae bacterium]|nr:asparagine synthase (glutamine-hydrolyzing) [Saprospiraceae bacterium]
MCGIAGIYQKHLCRNLSGMQLELSHMNHLIRHRGPDGFGHHFSENLRIGLTHRRLSIIDTSATGNQPMVFDNGQTVIIYNGELYNYLELKDELKSHFPFRTQSDTEVIVAAYRHWGEACLQRFRGMFAFAIWSAEKQELFLARDRFGIKPLYFLETEEAIYFGSECKALLPFVEKVEIDREGLKDYLAFQFCLDGKTLFKNIRELLPAHQMTIRPDSVELKRYWEVNYHPDFEKSSDYFENELRELLHESVKYHLRSDVPVGAYVSGGIDSSAIASIAADESTDEFLGFTGKFSFGTDYDESAYALDLARSKNFSLHQIDIVEKDFTDQIQKVIYHLDFPVAGPGSFPQFMVSSLAAKYRKVVLGGQGGDEIFGGYTRYLIAYFEQCIKAAINGTQNNGNFIVTYESIIPNLISLRNYKPMLQEFWRDGLFEEMDHRYFRLINRAPHLGDAIRWELLEDYHPFESFQKIFNGDNVGKQSYFDQMTHFDFKTLLPALLQVEDRMSMAHGLESRVPLLDHKIVELAATIPSNIKFENGDMKHIFKKVVKPLLPDSILQRKDKMGFPTPLVEWSKKSPVREFILDLFSTAASKHRSYIDNSKVMEKIQNETRFGRNLWAFLCLELWQSEFLDKNHSIQNIATSNKIKIS